MNLKLQYFFNANIQFRIKFKNMIVDGSKERLKHSAFSKFQAHSTDSIQVNLQEVNEFHFMTQMILAQNITIRKLLQSERLLLLQLSKEGTATAANSQNLEQNIHDFGLFDKEKEHQSQHNQSLFQSEEYLLQKNNKAIDKVVTPFEFSTTQKIAEFKRKCNSSICLAKRQRSKQRKQISVKNVINSLVKGLFTFIQRNRVKRRKLLLFLRMDEKEFMTCVEHYLDEIHSVDQLRSLWACSDSHFHRALRILSLEYLRKHCLSLIFSNKIENYSAHLKYKNFLQQTVQNLCSSTANEIN